MATRNTTLRLTRAIRSPKAVEVTAQQADYGDLDRRKRRVPACVRRTRVYRGRLVADIIVDRRSEPEIVHCIIQQQGSAEVLFLEQFYTREEAEEAVDNFIAEYVSKHPQARQLAA